MPNGKAMTISLTVELMKNISLYKMSYFPKAYTHSKSKIKNELDLPNYATKSNLISAIDANTSKFAKELI